MIIDVNDADRENYGVEDDENENIEPLFDHSDNEIEDDGSEDDFENDDVELEILQVPQSQKQTGQLEYHGLFVFFIFFRLN